MNKFVFSALAATLVGATGFASDWSELDSELAALNNAPLTQDAGGPIVTGWLIGALDYNSDSETNNANDSQGFNVHASRVQISGSAGEGLGYVVGFDFTDSGELYAPGGTPLGTVGNGGLVDAYGTFTIGEQLNGKIGVFRMPFLRSQLIDRNDTLFIDRSMLGGMYASRDTGVSLGGSFDRINWEVAIMNGFDNQGEGWAWGGRVDMDVIGSSANCEGALGAAEGTNLNIGLAIQDDTSDATLGGASRDAMQWAIDATLTMEGFSIFGEMVDHDKDVGDNSPYSVGASYLINEEYEAGLRWDDWDDVANTTRYNVVVNRYVNGHDAKWQLQYSGGSSDVTTNEDSIISLGLALGF